MQPIEHTETGKTTTTNECDEPDNSESTIEIQIGKRNWTDVEKWVTK